jgi:hypothetical protein
MLFKSIVFYLTLLILKSFYYENKKGITIVEQAIFAVPEFATVVTKLETQVTLRGQSKSTLNNYIRRIALFVINWCRVFAPFLPALFTKTFRKNSPIWNL